MRLPPDDKGVVDEARAIRQIRSAIDQGVNYMDTAWPYHEGKSEIILGKALKDGYREKVKVATKLPSWMINSRQDMDDYLNRQLEKLETDVIDYYLLHTLDGAAWDKLERLDVIDFMDKAQADGRIVNPGFSFHGAPGEFARIVDAYPWIFCQIQYNYLDIEAQAGTEGLKYAASKQLGVIVMEPLRGGNLGLAEAPPAIQAIWDEAEPKRTPVEWALRWIWDHPEVTVVLSGMNLEEHIAENLAIADAALPGSLTDDERERVKRVADKFRELMKTDCTGCCYCMPCPEGVMIPEIFETYNKLHMFGNEQEAKFVYAIRMSGGVSGREPGYASLCVQCGECVEKCPQQIEIPDHLADAVEDLEGPDLADRVAMVKEIFTKDKP